MVVQLMQCRGTEMTKKEHVRGSCLIEWCTLFSDQNYVIILGRAAMDLEETM